jgi:hypothetical protein
LEKCKHTQTKAFKHIKKIGNAFLDAQQMFVQQAIHITLSIPLHHATRFFQFINRCEGENRVFCIISTKNLECLPLDST